MLLTLSQAEAEKAGQNFIGTEHMLLASFAKPDFQSAVILDALGVKERDVRAAIYEVVARREGFRLGELIPTSRVKKVIELAFQICGAKGASHVSTAHVLLGLATEGDSIAAHVLEDLGGTRQRIEDEVAKLTEPEA